MASMVQAVTVNRNMSMYHTYKIELLLYSGSVPAQLSIVVFQRIQIV